LVEKRKKGDKNIQTFFLPRIQESTQGGLLNAERILKTKGAKLLWDRWEKDEKLLS
jgi:hypothetical protein